MANEMIPVIDLGPYLAGVPGAIDRIADELHFALTRASGPPLRIAEPDRWCGDWGALVGSPLLWVG
jgi:hypothetical protein